MLKLQQIITFKFIGVFIDYHSKLLHESKGLFNFRIVFVYQCLANTEQIPCANPEMLKNAALKIDTAQKVNDHYLVYSATVAYQANNLWWFIGVGDIFAHTPEKAVRK